MTLTVPDAKAIGRAAAEGSVIGWALFDGLHHAATQESTNRHFHGEWGVLTEIMEAEIVALCNLRWRTEELAELRDDR